MSIFGQSLGLELQSRKQEREKSLAHVMVAAPERPDVHLRCTKPSHLHWAFLASSALIWRPWTLPIPESRWEAVPVAGR